jgi:hypothetical protein
VFNKLLDLFAQKNDIDDVKEQEMKIVKSRLDLLEKKVADYEELIADHHKTIATIAFIQSNLLNEMDRAIKVASTNKNKRTVYHTTSSKGDDFIN